MYKQQEPENQLAEQNNRETRSEEINLFTDTKLDDHFPEEIPTLDLQSSNTTSAMKGQGMNRLTSLEEENICDFSFTKQLKAVSVRIKKL